MARERAIVLVHGAWGGGWCYGRVADLLRASGHRVYTPTLTGLADRSHLLSPAVNLSTHIADVVNLIRWEQLERVVLVGHSYGGVVVTGAADALADRVSSLVYLDAFLPTHGRSFHDIVPAELAAAQLHSAMSSQGLSVPPIPAALFDVNEADRDWVDSQSTPHPLATLTQTIELTGKHAQIGSRSYVFATRNSIPVFRGFASLAAADPSWSYHELPCGHMVMLDLPQQTAAIIEDAALRA